MYACYSRGGLEGIYCPLGYLLPFGVFTALWGIYCPLGYLLPFGVFTALWGIYCPLGYLLPFGVFKVLLTRDTPRSTSDTIRSPQITPDRSKTVFLLFPPMSTHICSII